MMNSTYLVVYGGRSSTKAVHNTTILFLDLGPMLYNLLRPYYTNLGNKLECLSLASLSSLAQYLQVRQGAYLSKAPSKCSIIGETLNIKIKYLTQLESTARDKHSSLLRKFVNYGRKKFYNIGPEQPDQWLED